MFKWKVILNNVLYVLMLLTLNLNADLQTDFEHLKDQIKSAQVNLEKAQRQNNKLNQYVEGLKLSAAVAKLNEIEQQLYANKAKSEAILSQRAVVQASEQQKNLKEKVNTARIMGNVKLLNLFKKRKEELKKLKSETTSKKDEAIKAQEVADQAKTNAHKAQKLAESFVILDLDNKTSINLKSIDPYTKLTFEELLNKKIKNNLPFLLVQITADVGNGRSHKKDSFFADAFEMSKDEFFFYNLPFEINSTPQFMNYPIDDIKYYIIRGKNKNQITSFRINDFKDNVIVDINYDQLTKFIKNLSQNELLEILAHIKNMFTYAVSDELLNLGLEIIKNGNLPIDIKVQEIKYFNSLKIHTDKFIDIFFQIFNKNDLSGQNYIALESIYKELINEVSFWKKEEFINEFYRKGFTQQAKKLYKSILDDPQVTINQKVYLMQNFASVLEEGNKNIEPDEIGAFAIYKQLIEDTILNAELSDFQRQQILLKLGLAYQYGLANKNKDIIVKKDPSASFKIFNEIVNSNKIPMLKTKQKFDFERNKLEATVELAKIYIDHLPLSDENISKAKELLNAIMLNKRSTKEMKDITLNYITKLNEKIKKQIASSKEENEFKEIYKEKTKDDIKEEKVNERNIIDKVRIPKIRIHPLRQ